MTRSLFRKADGPSHSSYRKSVALKLTAFVLALAVFFPLTALLSRPKPLKDLSGGVLPLTFGTRDKALQRELSALYAAHALPKQRDEAQAIGSRRLCEAIDMALSGPEFQRLKTELDQLSAALASHSQNAPPEGLQGKLDILWQMQGQFDSALDIRQIQRPLLMAFSYGESCQSTVSLKYLGEDGASPLPELQELLEAKFALQLSANDLQGALRTLELMLKMANCVLNSDEPEIHYLNSTLDLAAQSLQTRIWANSAAVKDLHALLQRQRVRPIPQRGILAFEREKSLITFERIRKNGFNTMEASANMIADSLRELKPASAIKAADYLWRGLSYDPDFDEAQTLGLFDKLTGPSFLPYFKSPPLLGGDRDDDPLTAKTKADLRNCLRRQSEAIALLDAMEIAIALHLEMEPERVKVSPLSGHPYGILKGQDRYKIVYGQTDTEALVIDN
jgi:hypothetical protein